MANQPPNFHVIPHHIHALGHVELLMPGQVVVPAPHHLPPIDNDNPAEFFHRNRNQAVVCVICGVILKPTVSSYDSCHLIGNYNSLTLLLDFLGDWQPGA